MKKLPLFALLAAVLVLAVIWWQTPQPIEPLPPPQPLTPDPNSPSFNESALIPSTAADANSNPDVEDDTDTIKESSAVPEEPTVINIGEPMDPDDPSTWPQADNTEVINIGEPMDPDDPSTWPQPDNTEVINIGEPMDPDDPSTWPQSDNTEVINIGEPMDPDDPSTWQQSGGDEVINIGEPMDPDDPYGGW